MSNLAQRIMSALVLAVVFIGALWLSKTVFFVLIGIVMILSLREWINMLKISGEIVLNDLATVGLLSVVSALSLFITLYIFPQSIVLDQVYVNGTNSILDIRIFLLMAVLQFVSFIVLLLKNPKNGLKNSMVYVMGLIWIALPFSLVTFIAHYNGQDAYQKELILASMTIALSSDVFAYFVGSSIGKTKFFEKVSPKKTWEGAIGGLLGGMFVAFLIPKVLETPLTGSQWLVLGAIVVIASVCGDLFESMVKRNLGVKDSGTSIPGHGGILDRIDGLLFVVPAVAAYLYFI